MGFWSALLCCRSDDVNRATAITSIRLHNTRQESPSQTTACTTKPTKPLAAGQASVIATAPATTTTSTAIATHSQASQPPLSTPPETPPTAASMAPSSTAQRNAVAEFMSLTKADKTTASRYLKNSNYNVQSAINAYYNDGPSIPSSGTRNELSKLFDKYRENPKESPNSIGMEGTQKYCSDIGVSVEDITFFLLSEIVQSPAMGEIERDKFVDGWALLNVSDTKKQQSTIAARKAQLSTPANRDVLKRAYKHAFKMFIQPPKRTLDVETSIALWTPFFGPQALHWEAGGTDWFALWCDFMTNKNKRPVNRDVWDQTFVFAEKTLEHGDVGFWSEDGAWPGVVDEFVEWVKERQGSGGAADAAMEIE